MNIQFVPIDYDYFDFEGKNFVRLIGRNGEGKRICVVDSFEANFWAVLKDGLSDKKIDSLIKKIEKIKVKKASRETRVLKVEKHEKNFLGEKRKALRIFIDNFKDAHAVADELGFDEIDKRREYDLSLVTKYIMEKKVKPLNFYEVEVETLDREDFGFLKDKLEVADCFLAKSFSGIDEKFSPRILAYDIETDAYEIGKGDVLMISLYGRDGKKEFKKVLTWKKCSKKQDFVECFSSEEKMLEAFVDCVKDFGPDFLVGYFSDGFDLPYLRAAAENNRIKLPLGLDGSQPSFARGKIPSGKISGIVHIDLFRFIQTAYSQYLSSETLSLDDVASELLGESKLDFDFTKLSKMQENDWRDFFEYNLRDSEVTWKLADSLWPDLLELTKVVGEPSFNVSRAGLSSLVENFIIHNLGRFNEIVEKRPEHNAIAERRARGKFEGAFVFQPTPGLYEDVAIFDFTSMHTSIIVSFNISKTTLLDKKEKGSYETPEINFKEGKKKLYFSKEQGFFPSLLKEIFEKRKKFKKEYKKNPSPITKARSNVFKLLSASVHGYQAFFGARYYSFEAASAVLAFVRKYNQEIIDRANKEGYKSIYADTDSIAMLLEGKTKKDAKDFLKKINSELPGIMELDLEDFYKRALFVAKRTTEAGAKKKYALIDEKGEMKVRGFETVRRDWCALAREVQNEILEKVLKNGDEKEALEFLRKIVDKIKKREVDKKDLMIRTQLKKPIKEYLSEGPHVVAAKKMVERGLPVSAGSLIEYYVGFNGSKKKLKVGERVRLPDEDAEYDIDYYLDNQIFPAVENIFDVFGVDLESVFADETQKKLF